MNRVRSMLVMALAAVPGLLLPGSAAGQSAARETTGPTISVAPAPAGARTICIGKRRAGVRTVGCFDVYRLEGMASDPTRGIALGRYVWKYTAEAHGGTDRRLVRLLAAVNSTAGTTYDWAPEQSIELAEPGNVAATVTTDLVADSSDGGPPRLNNPTDGWSFRSLAGWFDPRLSDHEFATSWTARNGTSAPAGEAAQVAGATVWGAPAPGPPLLPARLRIEVTYR